MFKRYFIRGSSIQTKFLMATLFVVIVPLGIFGVMALQVSKQVIQTQVSQSHLKILGQIAEKTDMVLDDIVSVSNTFYLNPRVINGLTTAYTPGTYDEAMLRATFEELLRNAIYSFHNLRYDVTLLGHNGLQLSTDTELGKVDMALLRQESWYGDAAAAHGRILWVADSGPALSRAHPSDSPFYAMRVSTRFENGAPAGVVMIGVEEGMIMDLYAGSVDENQQIIIVDDQGSTISAMDSRFGQAPIRNRDYYAKIRDYDSGYFIDDESGQAQLIAFQTIDRTGWKLVSYTPLRSVLGHLDRAQAIVVSMLLAAMVISVVASYFIARRLAIPIKRLAYSFGRLETGDMSVRTVPRGNDEISLLSRRFNQMVERLDSLMKEYQTEQRRKRHAEMQALQSQINPHFLYNTLASIRFMLYKRDKEAIDSVIVALVRLLKQTLSRQDELIPIEEEWQILHNYLYIQQTRQGDRLQVRYDVDERVFHYSTLRFVMQPLVENAIFHGLERKRGTGTLLIKGYMDEGDVVFEVIDDGVGMSETALQRLREGHNKHSELTHGGGYSNVQERIRLYFGPRYGLSITSAEETGTRVVLRVPALHKWEEGARREAFDSGR
ncbi:cache domain-containing sensor histidine kinase [Paenibacillus sp. 1P07SE]|uniref:cache domain-containing sensor histidine kinase n=1 Tax=Paenibacillus sp. 1P07SE TaxID=3132209 RepID=UPI0039A7812B